MKKKKQMLGLAVATTVAVFGQDVQAEEIITANSPTEAEAISATTSTETVTAQDVADAKALVDEASEQVQVVEELISVTETALAKEQEASQETATSLAQAEAITAETVATAQEAIVTTEQAQTTAQASVTASQTEKAEAEQAVANQEKVVTTATTEVASAEATVKATEDKIVALEGNGVADVEKLQGDVTTLETTVASDEVAVANAQASLDNAKEASSNREVAVANQQGVVASAEAQVDSTAKAYADAISAKEATSNALTTAQSNLDTANDNLGSVNVVPIVGEYIAMLKDYLASPSQEKSDSLKELGISAMQQVGFVGWDGTGVYKVFESTFKATEVDKSTTIHDINNLSYDIRLDLNKFGIELINQLRVAFGTEEALLNTDMIEIAQEIASSSTRIFGHDIAVLDTIGVKYGINSGPYGMFNENIGYEYPSVGTVAELKENIYYNIISMLYNDAHASWGHATSLTGIKRKDNSPWSQYMGLGFKSNSTYGSVIHFVGTSDNIKSVADGSSKLDITANIELKDSTTSLIEQYNLAQNAYNTALANDNSAQTTLDSTKTAYEAAQTAYAEAQAQLNSIIAGTIDISSLETALNNALAKLEADKVALQSAKEVLALAKASATDKAVALENAKAELETAKGVLAEKQASLSAEEAKLASLKADLASKETAYQTALAQLAETNSALETAKAKLAELEALVAQKPALAEALPISTAKIAELEALLAEQKASQVEASEALAQAQEAYALVKAEYDYLMELERLSVDNTVTVLEDGTVIAVPKDAPTAPVLPSISLEDWLKAKEAEIVASGQVAVPLVNQAGQVIGYEAQTIAKPQAPVAPVAQASKGQASLPNTGQASNLLLFVGLGTLGLAVGVRRKGEKG
ncbi:TPA: SEC10/PgrA surface exclusion domain-containing protein [Streptococcus suis]